MGTDAVASLVALLVVIVIYFIFFFWQKHIVTDLLKEKGYEKKIGALLFFMPVVCWVYACALPNKNK